jgi:acyl-coenzyme A synthetase/AMP-(fatty) acid ligase
VPELRTSAFLVNASQDPVEYYVSLFALWENGNRVVFPTRDYLHDKSSIEYYKYEVDCASGALRVRENMDFHEIDIDERGDTVVFSSGSTGTPKGILHNKEHFLKNALAVSEVVGMEGVTNVTFLKPYLVSAISHFIVHFLTNSHLVFADFDRVEDITELYEKHKDLGVVGSPMHIVASYKCIPNGASPRMFFSSGDFVAGNTIASILERFPGARYYNVYGLAELAGRFFVNEIDARRPEAEFESIGRNIKGTDYSIREGELYVTSDFKFYGYIKNNSFEPSEPFHPTGDLVFRDENGLFLYGRTNDEFKILGNKVSVKHIEGKIKNVLKHDIAILLPTPHPNFGTILSLVLNSELRLRRTELIRALRGGLLPHEMPHKYYYISEFPFTDTMKVDRVAILKQLDSLEVVRA